MTFRWQLLCSWCQSLVSWIHPDSVTEGQVRESAEDESPATQSIANYYSGSRQHFWYRSLRNPWLIFFYFKTPLLTQLSGAFQYVIKTKKIIYLIVGFCILLRVYPLMLFLKPPYATMYLCSFYCALLATSSTDTLLRTVVLRKALVKKLYSAAWVR
jgi:hypothetical protein